MGGGHGANKYRVFLGGTFQIVGLFLDSLHTESQQSHNLNG